MSSQKNLLSKTRPATSFDFYGIPNSENAIDNLLLFSSLFLTALSFVVVEHPYTAIYPEEFIANAHAVASLAQESWENISVKRIRRVIDRISKSKFFCLNIASFSFTV